AVRHRPVVCAPVPQLVRVPRGAPVLYVVLGRPRHGPPGRRDLRGGRPAGGASDGGQGGGGVRRRAGEGGRHGGFEPAHRVPARTAAGAGGGAVMGESLALTWENVAERVFAQMKSSFGYFSAQEAA